MPTVIPGVTSERILFNSLLIKSNYDLLTSLGSVDKMRFISPKDFTADHAWGALPIANMNGITTKLHWTDQPYRWHVNDGEEVFVVLDGVVEMHYRDDGQETVRRMAAGDIFYADLGTEHVAYPLGEARVLVIEKEDSA